MIQWKNHVSAFTGAHHHLDNSFILVQQIAVVFVAPVVIAKAHQLKFVSNSRTAEFESDSQTTNFSSESASFIMECVGEPTEIGFVLLEDGGFLLLEDGGKVKLENV